MPTPLSVVIRPLTVEGRGFFLVIDNHWEIPKSESIQRGEPLLLRLPDVKELRTHIDALEAISYADRFEAHTAIKLPKEFPKTEVPPGTQLLLLRD